MIHTKRNSNDKDKGIVRDLSEMRKDPTLWQFKAANLLFASKYLHAVYSDETDPLRRQLSGEARLGDIVLMLEAMAVEDLLKAVYVRETGSIKGANNSHELKVLAEQVSTKVSFSIDELEFLKKLGEYIWNGRYPFPQEEKKLALRKIRRTKLKSEIFEKNISEDNKKQQWDSLEKVLPPKGVSMYEISDSWTTADDKLLKGILEKLHKL